MLVCYKDIWTKAHDNNSPRFPGLASITLWLTHGGTGIVNAHIWSAMSSCDVCNSLHDLTLSSIYRAMWLQLILQWFAWSNAVIAWCFPAASREAMQLSRGVWNSSRNVSKLSHDVWNSLRNVCFSSRDVTHFFAQCGHRQFRNKRPTINICDGANGRMN